MAYNKKNSLMPKTQKEKNILLLGLAVGVVVSAAVPKVQMKTRQTLLKTGILKGGAI